MQLPLAWLQLKSEKLRLAAAIAGIAFAAIMMLMQLGFHDALFKSCTRLHSSLEADLVLLSSQFDSVISTKSFTQRRLYQALGFPSVISVIPLYLGTTKWKNPDTFLDREIFVIGVNPSAQALQLPGVGTNLALTKLEDVVLFDSSSRMEYGPIAARLARNKNVPVELGGRRVSVAGLFELGTSFAADGNLVTSDFNFLSLFSGRSPGMIDLGLIRLRAGANPAAVRDRMAATLPPDVKVVTREEFIELEKSYWAERTPIGFVITAGMIVGFVVGSVIVYQILYTDVIDHLKEYATLKAMGWTDRYLFSIVMQEAVVLSVLGFLPGCIGASGILYLTRKVTLLPAGLTIGRGLLVFALTLLMCGIAGAFATRKLRSADPAEIF